MGGIRAPLIMSLLIVAGMVLVSAWAWSTIPADARLAVHWDLSGLANGFASKSLALTLMPLIASALTVLFALVPFLGQSNNRRIMGMPAYTVGWIGTLLVLAVSHAVIVMIARGVAIDVAGNVTFAGAVLMIVLGNFMGKTETNDYVGVRTPWTKTSDLAWEKCNRLGGGMFVGLGLATLGALAAGIDRRRVTVGMLVAVLAMVAILFPLSRYYWQRDPDRENPD